MISELIVTLCLITTPSECIKERYTIEGGPFACYQQMVLTNPEIALRRPKYRIVKVACKLGVES